MKIVVTFAAESEFSPWRRLRSFRRVRCVEGALYETRIGAATVYAAVTGMGGHNAGRVIAPLLREAPDVCVSSGLAGGLRRRYLPRAVLVARAVCLKGSDQLIQSDEGLVRLAVRCGATAVDLFHSGENVVLTAKEKFRMGLVADAVEMESFAVMQETACRKVPAVAIRAIADPVEMDLPLDFNQATGRDGCVSVPRVLAQLARRPARLPALVRFGFESRRSAWALVSLLDRYAETLARFGTPSLAAAGEAQ
ncbi:MAG: hypothetical protein HYX74_06680 [Acidobacteria bacterium]|nr:hypothetical protein [Acidobacteriota bacterium]